MSSQQNNLRLQIQYILELWERRPHFPQAVLAPFCIKYLTEAINICYLCLDPPTVHKSQKVKQIIRVMNGI